MRAIVPALLLIGLVAPAQAVPGGKLRVLPQGSWTCEIPGDATVMPIAKPEASFAVVPDSSYIAPDGTRGSYLLLADELTMTSGTFNGRRFIMDGEEIMREVGGGNAQTGLRCVHAGPINLTAVG